MDTNRQAWLIADVGQDDQAEELARRHAVIANATDVDPNVVFEIGAVVGLRTIIGGPEHRGGKWATRCWLCRCVCGKESWVVEKNMQKAVTNGCMKCRNAKKVNPESLVGSTFGTWTALRILGSDTHGCYLVACRCNCGKTRTHKASVLRTGRMSACECQMEMARLGKVVRTHWKRMLWAAAVRELTVTITLREALDLLSEQDFKCALTGLPIGFARKMNMGPKESTTASIDRIDSDGHYTRENVIEELFGLGSGKPGVATGRIGGGVAVKAAEIAAGGTVIDKDGPYGISVAVT